MTFNTETAPAALLQCSEDACDRPGKDEAPTTLQDLQLAIGKAVDLPEDRRQQTKGDLGAFMRHLPETARLQPTRRALQRSLKRIVAAAPALGITRKRAQNIAASVEAALRWLDTGTFAIKSPLSPEWVVLKSSLGPRCFMRAGLNAFMVWCSESGVAPCTVTNDVVAGFYEFMLTQREKADARRLVNAAVGYWNALAQAGQAGWPATQLNKLPPAGCAVRTEQFSPEFIADLSQYAAVITGKASASAARKRFDENNGASAPRKVRRHLTARSRVYLLRRCAARLATARGVELASIKSLRDLLAPGAPQTIVEETYEDLGEGHSLVLALAALTDVAKSYVDVDAETRVRLDNLRRQIVQPDLAMTEKNRRLLRELSASDLAVLYALPGTLMREVERRLRAGLRLREVEFRAARAAVCLAFLLWTPPRISNLAMIRMPQNLVLPDQRGGAARLRFTAAEMKGRKPWDVPVHENALPIVKWYLSRVRPQLGGDPEILFPGEDGPLKPGTLRRDIRQALVAHSRTQPHPHFFRHLVAHRMLVRDPGNYEAVRQLLAHADVETTKKFYCGEEAEAALKHVARCLAAAAEETVAQAAVMRQQRSRHQAV